MYPKINDKNNMNYCSQELPQNILKNLRRVNSKDVYRGGVGGGVGVGVGRGSGSSGIDGNYGNFGNNIGKDSLIV